MPPTFENAEVTLAEPFGATEFATASEFGIGPAPRDPDRWQFVACGRDLALVAPRSEGAMRLALRGQGADGHHRLRSIRPQDPLLKAVGRNKDPAGRYVIDATGGLCRDAMSLAVLGYRTLAIERVPALALAAHWSTAHAGLTARLRVHSGEAIPFLQALEPAARPAAIYLDPMFGDGEAGDPAGSERKRRHAKNAPPRRAQVKKAMQFCRLLAGPPTDDVALLTTALAAATERVVVKRHPDMPPLAADVAFAVTGERVRFDVYLAPE